MTDRPLGAQIDAVLERARGDAGVAIREVLDEYADLLTGDMRSAAFRETERGAEILVLGSGRISIIGVDFDEPIVRFETRALRDAVVSLETELNSAKRRWRFKFPDGSALAIDGTLTRRRRHVRGRCAERGSRPGAAGRAAAERGCSETHRLARSSGHGPVGQPHHQGQAQEALRLECLCV
jgi:hypothetical protein